MTGNQLIARQAIELAINRLRSMPTDGPAVELVWTSHNRWPSPLPNTQHVRERPLHISILDSSFNPPTLAHFALATSEFPSQSTIGEAVRGFDARLLILSTRNADKSLKSTDATFAQRVEMMILMAQEMVTRSNQGSSSGPQHASPSLGNVAVGVINEPTIAGKSTKILRYLDMANMKNQVTLPSSYAPPAFRLSFLMGYDTLVRVFSPKFYDSKEHMKQTIHQLLSPTAEGGDGSFIVCARREQSLGVFKGSSPDDEELFLEQDTVKPYASSLAIRFIDISEADKVISSSQVRAGVGGYPDGTSDWQKMCLSSIAGFLQRESLYATLA